MPRCARARTAGTEAACGREGRSLRRTAKADAGLADGEWAGVGAGPRTRRRQGWRRSRDFADSHLALGAEGGHGSRGRGQPPQRRVTGARSARSGVRRKPTPGSQMMRGSPRAKGRGHDGDETGGGTENRRLALKLRARSASRCTKARTAAKEAACGCKERSRGERRQPAPRASRARSPARAGVARSTSAYSAARPRDSPNRPAGMCACWARARDRGKTFAIKGDTRARRSLARRTAATGGHRCQVPTNADVGALKTDDDSHARTTWFDVDDGSETAERHDVLGSFWGRPALGLWRQAALELATGTPGRRAAARGPWRLARPRLVRTNRTANCDGQTEAHRAWTTTTKNWVTPAGQN